jgi:hypothetical protein
MSDVARWLEELGLGHYAAAFVADEVDLQVLPRLTDQDLRELGLSLAPRKKSLAALEALATPPDESQEPAAKRSLAGLMIAKSARRRGEIAMQTAGSGPGTPSTALFATLPLTASGHPGNLGKDRAA